MEDEVFAVVVKDEIFPRETVDYVFKSLAKAETYLENLNFERYYNNDLKWFCKEDLSTATIQKVEVVE